MRLLRKRAEVRGFHTDTEPHPLLQCLGGSAPSGNWDEDGDCKEWPLVSDECVSEGSGRFLPLTPDGRRFHFIASVEPALYSVDAGCGIPLLCLGETMSYSIQIFHPLVREQTGQGREIDEFDHPPLDPSAVEKFISNLFKYEYSHEATTVQCREFVKCINGCPVQVAVFATEIAFSVPYWQNSQDAIFEALQDASELVEPEYMALFNPQIGEWAEA